ncbi:hypothetical protein WBG78_30465, partial [Chryseolinea sp. T2]|uniref:hypothetical protein n=1 Tax=Chryseolinea sp. T2 TaxID=3129255 RepID=UPI003077D925
MGLFDKLFGKTGKLDETSKNQIDTIQLVRTAEMLDEDKFWEIIQKSLKSTKSQDAQERYCLSPLISCANSEKQICTTKLGNNGK